MKRYLNSRSLHHQTRSNNSAIGMLKRPIDLGFCVLAMPLLMAVALPVAVIMRMTSPGPLIFRQERVGYRGQHFYLYKFRTMHMRPPTDGHRAFPAGRRNRANSARKCDQESASCMMRCGRLLRATGLDELPQIFNVLRGEMTLFGPRPVLPCESGILVPQHRRRLENIPGLMCW